MDAEITAIPTKRVAMPAEAAKSRNKLAKRAKPTELISHWAKLIDKLQCSPREFYAKVEKALVDRKVPGIVLSRVDWKEGGPLSARREYLRIVRERLTFDVCGAPFGRGFFVSVWCGVKPATLGLAAWLLIIASIIPPLEMLLWTIPDLRPTIRAIGPFFHLVHATGYSGAMRGLMFIVLATLILIIVRIGPNLDSFLIRVPIIGAIYERFFRSITFYRIDLMECYLQAVHSAVMEVVDEISKAQDIAPLSELERKPIFRGLLAMRGQRDRN